MQICFATSNPNKVREIQAMLPDYIRLLSLKDIGCLEELAEDQSTLEGNSHQKANYVFHNYHVPCFADDTGLEVFALDGAPGVISARYAGEQRDIGANMELLLSKLQGKEDRKAQFRTVITFINEDGKTRQFEGVVKGAITNNPQGGQGFGYDPIFIPKGYQQTFAQMAADEKNKISHRAIATQKLVKYLTKHF
ncbi:MAG: RdgB/HAM1 family non-canonical purine NTP pyrophosphatase [Bacteroidota bacterium]